MCEVWEEQLCNWIRMKMIIVPISAICVQWCRLYLSFLSSPPPFLLEINNYLFKIDLSDPQSCNSNSKSTPRSSTLFLSSYFFFPRCMDATIQGLYLLLYANIDLGHVEIQNIQFFSCLLDSNPLNCICPALSVLPVFELEQDQILLLRTKKLNSYCYQSLPTLGRSVWSSCTKKCSCIVLVRPKHKAWKHLLNSEMLELT